MKKISSKIAILMMAFMVNLGPIFASDYILATQAKEYEGYPGKVCGIVKSIQKTPKGTFIYFDYKYPHQLFYAVVWSDKEKSINQQIPLNTLKNQEVCVTGLIDSFNNVPLIIIEKADQLELINY